MPTINHKNVAVIGAGSWGTAIVKILSEHKKSSDSKMDNLMWWIRSAEKAKYISEKHHNPDYISSIEIHPDLVLVSNNLKEIVSKCDILVMAVPSAFLKQSLESIGAEDLKGKVIVSAIKGLLPHSKKIVGDFITDEFKVPESNIMVISGPCHAEEVAAEKLSYLTIAGSNQEMARHFASLLNNRYIRTVISNDVRGTEYGAVLKNIYAVMAGVCHGLGYGDNFQAVLMSNAIREMKRFLRNITDTNRKINHSAYLGDLLVTGYSQHSRNRTFGNMIGKGYTVKSAQLEMNMVAEGYYSIKTMFELNENLHIKMPILDAAYNIIYNNAPAKLEVEKLTEKLV
jgi:glycerol-3-phosphate dehydrogenase (NAD(P)+)